MTRDEFIGAIQNAAKAKHTSRFTHWAFIEQSGIAKQVSTSALRLYFGGSWPKACQAAGVSDRAAPRVNFGAQKDTRPSKDACIAELKRVAVQLGVTELPRELYRKHSGPGFSFSTIIRSLRKTWPECLKAAGLDSCEKAKQGWGLSKEESIDELRRIAATLPPGTKLTQDTFERAQPKFEINRLTRPFGSSWVRALSAAGLAPSKMYTRSKTPVSLDTLAVEFLEVTTQLKLIPFLKEMCFYKKRSRRLFSSHRPPDNSYAAFQRTAIEHLFAKNVPMRPEIRSLLEAHLKTLTN